MKSYINMGYYGKGLLREMFKLVIIAIFVCSLLSNIAYADPMHWLDEIEQLYYSGNCSAIEHVLQSNTPNTNIERAGHLYYTAKMAIHKEEIVGLLEQAIRMAPDSIYGQRSLTDLANISLLERDYNRSLNYLLQVNPQMISDRDYLLSSVYLRLERYPDAIRAAQDFIKITKDNVKRELSYFQIIEAYIQNEQYHQALLTLETMKNQNYVVNYPAIVDYKEGFCYEMTGQVNQAVDKYKSVIINYPYTEFAFRAERRLSDISIHHIDGDLYPPITTTQPERPLILTPPGTPTDHTEYYYVQVNAFSEEKNATAHSEYLRNLGYSNIVFSKEVYDRQLFVVAVGPFENQDAARSKQTDIKSRLNLESFIIKY